MAAQDPIAAPTVASGDDTTRNILRLMAEGGRAFATLMKRLDTSSGQAPQTSELADVAETACQVMCEWAKDPAPILEAQTALFMSYANLWSTTLLRGLGESPPPAAAPDPADNRFKDPEWSHNAYFDFCKQSYLIGSRWTESVLHNTGGLDERSRQKVDFYSRLLTSAFSPSNFPLTNPEVVRETVASNGQNLVEGMKNFASDLERARDVFQISQADPEAFEVGRNLAITPGKVVFQNDILQLIQYTPVTPQVREIPLLIVPPWINKFYILDLTPQKSFVRYAVEQGFTVFIVSWVNPDERLAHKTFEDYMLEGLLAAADAVTRETGAATCSVLGYCIGGTLVGSTLAYLAAREDTLFSSASFLTTQFDFSLSGDLALFTSDSALDGLEKIMADRGFLDSSRIANIFNMMRPRDLIWPYMVNNYLLGKKPMAFDILYWNQDSTRMPAANHKFYLREFYNANRLARGDMVVTGKAGAAGQEKSPRARPETTEDHILFYLKELRGETPLEPVEMSFKSFRLNLKKVTIPVFDLATKEDHIAPAVSVFKGAQLFGANVEFVVAGSGHIAGVINPPDKQKYQYWTADGRTAGGMAAAPLHDCPSLDEWMAGATEHPGSWWPHWAGWLAEVSGGWVDARTPGQRLGVIEDAPGSYVKVKG